MTNFSEISKQMREDWDRRVAHDHRFWMTESHQDDASMWSSGERDSNILLAAINNTEQKTALEIGCGIGRLLKAVAPRFTKVIGFDISGQAIAKAREYLSALPNVDLQVGDGYSLQPVKDKSVDVVYSFAAITSMPLEVAVNYLLEAHRVLKDDGVLRLQMYLGQEQLVASNDTLHLRCYSKDKFIQAVESCGYSVDFIEELVLPFKVSFKEIGIEAVIVSLRKSGSLPLSLDHIREKLLPGGEKQAQENGGREIECWMSLNYAKDLAEQGDIERATQALQYAQSFVKSCTIDVSDLLNRVLDTIEVQSQSKNQEISVQSKENSGEFYAKNLEVLQKYFPEAAQKILQAADSKATLRVNETAEGKVIHYNGVCLDHPEKPLKSANVWAKRVLDDNRYKAAAKLAVFGLGCGYHIEELIQARGSKICLIEPSIEVFNAAMRSRDLRALIEGLSELSIGEDSKLVWLDNETELIFRSQTQSLHSEQAEKLKSIFYGKQGLSALRPSIAVVGPMQGGTLPIMGYCLRSLLSLGQRTRVIDLSNFAGGYHSLESIIFNKLRQSTIQGTYVEMMSQVVLESIDEKPVDILISMAQAPLTGRALTELRKRGVTTVLWFVEDYLRFTYWKEIAQYYDFVFTIQRGECLEAIKSAGAGAAHYLPVACDPIVHAPMQLSEEDKKRWGSALSFVGAGYHNRQQMLAALCEYPFKVWGTEWPTCKPFDRLVQEGGRRLTPEEYTKIFCASDINLNLHSSSERDGVDPYGDFINPRTFELAACGAFQLCDRRLLLPEIFEYEKEISTFADMQELKEKINYYLSKPEERRQIAQNARKKVLSEHTYMHRLQEMLSLIFSKRYDHIKERIDKSPWKKILSRSAPHDELHKRCEGAFQRGEEPNLDGLVSDIISGKGKLSETEQKLMFLFHVKKQIINKQSAEGNNNA